MPNERAAPSSWQMARHDSTRAAALAAPLGILPITAQLLLNRGVDEPEAARRFLMPRLRELRRPDGAWEMAGFARAVGRLADAVVGRQTIGIFGDYDVDGITSCALLTAFLRGAGATVVAEVARRDRGYGFGVDDAAGFADAGCAVVVTCDCGTSDHDALGWARAHGLDVIVVDHHQVPERDPEALALINPHQPGCRFPFKGMASVGVAFYLAAALRTELRARRRPAPDPRTLLDLVAIGTIADLAPLTHENRILVHRGLEWLRRAPRPGLLALGRIAGLADGVTRAADVALRLAPRLNAPGRLGDARPALELLLAGAAEAETRAAACEAANLRRREVQEGVLAAAQAQAEAQAAHAVLLVAGQGWHAGVVGIIAAKLVERFGRPAFVIALDGELGRGSARTLGGFDLVAALRTAGDLLVRYGGHAAAAGLTIETARLGAVHERLDRAARAAHGDTPPPTVLPVDAEVALGAIDEPLAEEVSRLEPFGVGNPEPVLVAHDVVVERVRVVGQGHLQVTLRDGADARDGIGFWLADRDPGLGARVRAAFVPEVDTFRGVRRVRVRLRDLVRHGA